MTKFYHIGNMPEREKKYTNSYNTDKGMHEIFGEDDVRYGADFLHMDRAQAYCDQLNGGEPTRFESIMDENGVRTLQSNISPIEYNNVVHLGEWNLSHLFKVYDNNPNNYDLFIGTLGNEEYLPFKA